MKICFLGAGSTVFAKNVLGDCILTENLGEFHIALHDIDAKRLDESFRLINALNKKYNGKATITAHLNRREALDGANYIVNAIQVGGYKPSTEVDFKIPKKYGLKQTIGDTLGIGGIMRGLRTIEVLKDFARDIEELCPNALFLNYTNPMAICAGYLQTYTKVKAVGLCHSVQVCIPNLLEELGMEEYINTAKGSIFGINHQAWLVNLFDGDGNDLYEKVRQRSLDIGVTKSSDRVRREIMRTFGYYVTESSEHTAEYTPYFIKDLYPGLISKYRVPLDEYPRRCRNQIRNWIKLSKKIESDEMIEHKRSNEYGSHIIEAHFTDTPFTFNGNFPNKNGLISNLPLEACVEVPTVVDGQGFRPLKCGALPEQCAALNRTNINVQLLTLQASQTHKLSDVVLAAALDPHTASELSLDDIKKMVKELCKAHYKDGYLPIFED